MQFPKRFSNLPDYAFPRLRALLSGHAPGGDEIAMSIGEPRHAFPSFVAEVLAANIQGFAKYPPNDGSSDLRVAISDWLGRRYDVLKDPETEIVVLNGTREGLFNAALALCPEEKQGRAVNILIPNPFYQVYAVAAAACNAEAIFIDSPAENQFLPDFSKVSPQVLDQTAIVYMCSPSNPQGAIASHDYWAKLLRLAEKHDFKIFADECYSEIYRDQPPIGILQVAKAQDADPERILAFHSLSKRSNLPGLRSGFVTGGTQSIAQIKRLKAYAGAPLPLPLQKVAEAVWADEIHVKENRRLYLEKYAIADKIFADLPGYNAPEAGFFLWLPVPDGEKAAVKLWRETGVKVLPGAYLSRDVQGVNPGQGFIRVAMVAEIKEMQRGLIALRACLYE